MRPRIPAAPQFAPALTARVRVFTPFLATVVIFLIVGACVRGHWRAGVRASITRRARAGRPSRLRPRLPARHIHASYPHPYPLLQPPPNRLPRPYTQPPPQPPLGSMIGSNVAVVSASGLQIVGAVRAGKAAATSQQLLLPTPASDA